MAKLTIAQLDLAGRRVFVRADLNAPLDHGTVTDDTRLRAVVPTIQHALKAGASVVLASHLGRPKGKVASEFSLRPIAQRLESLLGQHVELAPDCVGAATLEQARALAPGQVLLLENLRFHPEEEANDDGFARALAELAECYVDDAFAAAHRAHASIAAITKHLQPAAAGLLMQQELTALGRILESPQPPLVAILGGAKVSDKIPWSSTCSRRSTRCSSAVAWPSPSCARSATRWGARSSSPIRSRRRGARSTPRGAAAWRWCCRSTRSSPTVSTAHRVALSASARSRPARWGSISDLGPSNGSPKRLSDARTIVWNGPMGVFEKPAFAAGTLALGRAVAGASAFTVIGGGDTVAAVTQAGVADQIGYISTAGGAFLVSRAASCRVSRR